MRLWKTVAGERSTGVLPFTKDWFPDFLASDDYQSALDLLKRCHNSNNPKILIAANPQWFCTETCSSPSGILLTPTGFEERIQWVGDYEPYETSGTRAIEPDQVMKLLVEWNSVGHLEEIHARLDLLTIEVLRSDSIAPQYRNIY